MTVAQTRPVPNLVGETRLGDTLFTLVPDTKRSSEFSTILPGYVAKLSVGIDGNGGAIPTTTATLRGLVYQSGVLLSVGDEVVVTSGDALTWRDLPFTVAAPGGVSIAAGEVEFGVLVGGTANLIRVMQIDPDSPWGGGRTNADAYAGGASNPYGSATSLSATMSIFATIASQWEENSAAPGDVIAKLGFADAQILLSGTLQDETYETTTSWHGTVVDENRGSFAVVRSGGALEGLVGKKIQVTSKTHNRSVIVYVTAKTPSLDADVSLARRAFAQLDLLSADFLDVHLRVTV